MARRGAQARLDELLVTFARSRRPIDVSFRELFRLATRRERATHDLHPYPARLLVNIPSFFLSTNYSQPGDTVLDPFCGAGTVLLEAVLARRNAYGADSNPLARLLTRTKLTALSADQLRRGTRSLLSRIQDSPSSDPPPVVNLKYWFHPHVIRDLTCIREAITKTRLVPLRDFFFITLSSCLRDLSLADPRLSVPVKLRRDQYPERHWLHNPTRARLARLRTINVRRIFEQRLDANVKALLRLQQHPTLGRLRGLSDDARNMTPVANDSVALVITSPPYVGSQKYVRASSLSLGWLGLARDTDLRGLESKNIGREHYAKDEYVRALNPHVPEAARLLRSIRRSDPLRAHIAANYLHEMRASLREIWRVLKPGHRAVVVVGESRVCGRTFPTPMYLTRLALREGFQLELHLTDTIRSRSLMTRRHHTAGVIATESILVLQKRSRRNAR